MARKVGTPGLLPSPINASFLGQSIKYPLAVDSSGRLQLSSGPDSVSDALIFILCTQPGECPMMPSNFGANVGILEPINSNLVELNFKTSVALYEPRVQSIDFFSIDIQDDLSTAIITIRYTIAGKATPQTVTFPYFKGPAVP